MDHHLSSPESDRVPAIDVDSQWEHIRAARLEVDEAGARARSDLPQVTGFEIVRAIHHGGQGEVFEAIQVSTGQRVAIKLLYRSDPGLKERFRREVDALAILKHPGIVRIIDTGEAERRFFLVMEYIDGVPLDKLLTQETSDGDLHLHGLPARLAVELVRELCEAVSAAHSERIFHRDLKPSNILVEPDGKPHIIDFGLAKCYEQDATLTNTGSFVGTFSWSSPEQLNGETLDATTDVYSLGLILHFLLTGESPYPEAKTLSRAIELVRTTDAQPPSRGRPKISRDIDAIVLKCREKDRRMRYRDAADLGQDLRRYLVGDPVQARSASWWYFARKKLRKHWKKCAVSVVVMIVALILLSRERGVSRSAAWRGYVANITAAQEAFDHNEIKGMRDRLDACPKELRNWEWRWLHRLSDQSSRTLSGHRLEISRLAIDSKTGRLWSSSKDGSMRQWDTDTGKTLRVIGDAGLKLNGCVALSRDGDLLVSGGTDGIVRIWNTQSGKQVMSFTHQKGRIEDVTFCCKDTRILTCCADHTLRTWDITSGKLIKERTREACYSMVTPDATGERFVTKCDGSMQLWNAGDLRLLKSFADSRDTDQVSFSFDGKWLAGTDSRGSVDEKNVRIWDVNSVKPVASLIGHQATISAIAFSPDSQTLASGAMDNTLRLWDISKLATNGSCKCIKVFHGHTHEIDCLAFSRDGRQIISGSNDFTIKIWNPDAPNCPSALDPADKESFAISPDGNWLGVTTFGKICGIEILDSASGKRMCTFGDGQAPRRWLSFNPNGHQIVAEVDYNELEQWDFTPPSAGRSGGGRLIRRFQAHSKEGNGIHVITHRPDGKMFASGADDKTVKLWSIATGSLVRTLEHKDRVWAAAFSPDGRLLATGSYDRNIRLWNPDTGECVRIIKESCPILAVAFSPDGEQLVAARTANNAPLRVFDVATGRQQLDLIGHTKDSYGVAWSPDGSRIASANADGTVKVWDAVNGECTMTLREFDSYPFSVAFSPDGYSILASGDKTVRIWDTHDPRSPDQHR